MLSDPWIYDRSGDVLVHQVEIMWYLHDAPRYWIDALYYYELMVSRRLHLGNNPSRKKA